MPTSPRSRPPLDRAALAATASPWRVEVVDEAASTNALVSARARTGETGGLVVVAEHQTSGRGRLGRGWETPPLAALTFSVLLGPAVALPRWTWLSPLAGLAVAEGVRRVSGLDCTLKWPNDVLAGEGKLAGILVEQVDAPSGPRAVVGIGVNVHQTTDELPVRSATSLALEGRSGVDRTALLMAVLDALDHLASDWVGAGGDAEAGLRAAYLARCSTVGRSVQVLLPTGDAVAGAATDVDADGRLVVTGDGGRTVVHAGDVVHVRPG